MAILFYTFSAHSQYFEDYLKGLISKLKIFNIHYKTIYCGSSDIIDITEDDIHIFFQTIYGNLNIISPKNNIYILNTEQLKVRNQNILNYNFNYIDWTQLNMHYYLSRPKSSAYLISYQVNYDEIFNYPKSKDVCMFTQRWSEYRNNIFNKCKDIYPNITSISGFGKIRDEILFQHKILINASLEPDCSVLEQFRVNRCIYNRIIIISDKKDDSDIDFILNKYIIYVENYLDIPSKMLDVLNNYKMYYDNIYGNFDKELPLIDEYFTKQIKDFISSR